MYQTTYDTQLLAEHYDVQPQAIIWFQPIRAEGGNHITDFEFAYCNDEGLKYLNLNREQLKGLSLLNTPRLNDELRGAILEEVRMVYDTGKKSETVIFNSVLDKYARVLRTKLRDGVLTVVQDITKEKTIIRQLEQQTKQLENVQLELENTAATLKSVFDYAQTGMFTFSPEYNGEGRIIDFRFVMVNSTVAEYAGQPADALEGQLGVKWFPGYLTNGEFDMYKHCFETGEPQRKELYYHLDGRDFYLDLQSVKIGQQLLVSLTDHTILRKSKLDLEQTVKALELSNTHLEDFAHAASHDMKEPIRKIQTFSDRLKISLNDRMTEDEKALFQRIEASAQRMQLLVDDLLEFSHVSEQPHEMELVDLNEKIQRVLYDLELPITEKKAKIIVNPLPVVRGNRRQLQQLFQNLISNAIKYSKPNEPPVVTISYNTVKGGVAPASLPAEHADKPFHLIEVSDNGIGFEQQYAQQIFEMFQRLHGKAEYSGTGIGLSIARKVVQNHQGYIWAEGERNKGAAFKVMLPVV